MVFQLGSESQGRYMVDSALYPAHKMLSWYMVEENWNYNSLVSLIQIWLILQQKIKLRNHFYRKFFMKKINFDS